MKLFISWSGDTSKAIALALRGWIPLVIQEVEPWMSEIDMEKGGRSLIQLGKELEEAKFGIACLTPENLKAEWLHFEAGAISKVAEQSFLWTYLYRLEYSDVKGPLSFFQHTKADENDTFKLLKSINKACGKKQIPEANVKTLFDRLWPDLAGQLEGIQEPVRKQSPNRSDRDVLNELLELARATATKGAQLESLINTLVDRIPASSITVGPSIPGVKLVPSDTAKAMAAWIKEVKDLEDTLPSSAIRLTDQLAHLQAASGTTMPPKPEK